MNNIKIIGIDLAKEIFHLHVANKNGEEIFKKKINSRKRFLEFISNLDADRKECVIAMEGCSGANYFAKKFRGFGYENVKIIAAQFVKPYVKTNKNDFMDASAIVKAALDPDMRFCSIKEDWQQDITNFHRVRSRLIKQRTALGNEIRGLLAEYGKIAPRSINKLRQRLMLFVNGEIIDNKNINIQNLNININDDFSIHAKEIFNDLLDELDLINQRVGKIEIKLKEIAKNNKYCQKLQKIPGIGLISSTSLISELGNAKNFKNGRELSSYLGLVPKQSSSGGKNNLLGISKRGNKYLRTLLIHGSRAVMTSVDRSKNMQNNQFAKNKDLYNWFSNLRKRKNNNVAVVALANKIARICFVILNKDQEYKESFC